MKPNLKKLLMTLLIGGGLIGYAVTSDAQERLPEYLQAEKFTQKKLNTMLFSTTVDPHWFQKGNCFWYVYKTSEGTFWYVVDPVKKSRQQLFDRDKIAAQLTEIVHDPFEARHLPIENLKAAEDGRTFTFEVTSSKDAKPDKDKKDKKNVPKIRANITALRVRNKLINFLEINSKTFVFFSPATTASIQKSDIKVLYSK